MASTGLTLKREAVTQAWQLWIKSATGDTPVIERYPDGVDISWKPGQAQKMEQYLSEAMKPGKPDPDALNVSVKLGPVLYPLIIKKTLGYAVAYTAIVAIATKLIWK